ncbi:carbohydrate ABC transporter permease [Candidatus Phytoplasma solani]|nr:carbohydrate ABC transporter permease [Candidatus Phytoplasma solani]CCP88146.1 ABC-type maltose transport system, permease protein [Candidatus Phytoplasma solani]CCP88869.1 ABC-type maltose transport system, permease protein [Candidatus Phytoplasma solani]
MNKIKSNFLIFQKKLSEVLLVFLKYLFLFIFAFFLILPFYWMLNIALQKESSTISYFPINFTFENFIGFFKSSRLEFFSAFFKTIGIVLVSTLLGCFISVITAFALSILEFKTKKIVFGVFLMTTMVTTESMFLTNYQTFANLGLVDSGTGSKIPGGVYFALILPFLVNVVHIFLLIQNIKKIPKELYLSAKIDGSSDFKFLYKILIPLLKNNLINIFIFSAVAAWNAYLWPSLVGGKTLTVLVRKTFSSEIKETLLHQQMAAITLITIPLILLFVVCKKYVLEGRLNSGIKG